MVWQMTSTDNNRVIELAISLLDASDLATARADKPSLSAARLVRYARRRDSVLDFAIEQQLRQNPVIMRLYNNLMQQTSMAYSPMAIAAGDGMIVKRMIGPHQLELVEDGGDQFVIIRLGGHLDQPPRLLEIRCENKGAVRLTLPRPVGKIMQMQLDLEAEDGKTAFELLGDPASALFLMM